MEENVKKRGSLPVIRSGAEGQAEGEEGTFGNRTQDCNQDQMCIPSEELHEKIQLEDKAPVRRLESLWSEEAPNRSLVNYPHTFLTVFQTI